MGKLIYGKNTVLDAIKNKLPVKNLYILKKNSFNFSSDIKIKIIEKKEMDKICNGNHQGFIAELKEFNYFSLEEIIKNKPNKILVLDRIQDPHNFGAILRTANAFGYKYIMIAKDRQVDVTPTVLKVSSGGYINIKIIRVNSMSTAIKKLKENGIWIYSTAIKNGISIKEITFNEPFAIILGNEGKGVSKTILKLSDQNVFIPTEGTIQSLNVSVAAGIILSK
ncbi:MAG: 23S rRNA (guanosine(2251)-2'-O)-methyltransferase RlmB [Mycoplasma sp.]|nr:23S rRNA (guanosine(2251)-2'-O)-methyltransferase RlmB [Mycoplasma sp.]